MKIETGSILSSSLDTLIRSHGLHVVEFETLRLQVLTNIATNKELQDYRTTKLYRKQFTQLRALKPIGLLILQY